MFFSLFYMRNVKTYSDASSILSDLRISKHQINFTAPEEISEKTAYFSNSRFLSKIYYILFAQ